MSDYEALFGWMRRQVRYTQAPDAPLADLDLDDRAGERALVRRALTMIEEHRATLARARVLVPSSSLDEARRSLLALELSLRGAR